jgi:hypothetical protein
MERSNEWATSGCPSFGAMVFREDGSAASVVVSGLSFDGCSLCSDVQFSAGERLRLYRKGQGCIAMTVAECSAGQFRMLFLTDCQV